MLRSQMAIRFWELEQSRFVKVSRLLLRASLSLSIIIVLISSTTCWYIYYCTIAFFLGQEQVHNKAKPLAIHDTTSIANYFTAAKHSALVYCSSL